MRGKPIALKKRIVYADDVHIALLKAGWNIREAADFVNAIPSVPVATNADKVRAMSDGELAEYLIDEIADCPFHGRACGIGGCTDCFLEWLKAPAEGGAEDGK